MPFQPGESGNPSGRPRGARNKATLALEEVLDAESDTIVRKVVERATSGDMIALRLCLDRLLAPRKDRPVTFELPPIAAAADAVQASAAIVAAVAAGELTPSEAAHMSNVVGDFVRAIEATEFEARLERLEQSVQPGRASE